jgi:hypothetical protein
VCVVGPSLLQDITFPVLKSINLFGDGAIQISRHDNLNTIAFPSLQQVSAGSAIVVSRNNALQQLSFPTLASVNATVFGSVSFAFHLMFSGETTCVNLLNLVQFKQSSLSVYVPSHVGDGKSMLK